MLEKKKEEFVYIFELASRVRPLFNRYGFSFEDFTNPYQAGIADSGFVDGEHASENAYRHLWSIWKERDPVLKHFSA